MDCETFDTHVIDELYGELDEATHAATQHHMVGCARCSRLLRGLQATRDVAALPLVEPDDALEARILEATARVGAHTPWHRKVVRAVAWAGSHAMRPQLAMAAVLLLMLGSSLLLLRARPGSPGAAPVRVTERGSPAPESASEVAPTGAAPSSAVLSEGLVVGEPPRATERKTSVDVGSPAPSKDAPEADGDVEQRAAGRDEPAMAALTAARALRSKSGCSAALGKLDEVGARYTGSVAAAEAMWDAAACHKQSGNLERAREIYALLKDNPAFRDRAKREIATVETSLGNARIQARGAGAQGTSRPAAAVPAAPAQAADAASETAH